MSDLVGTQIVGFLMHRLNCHAVSIAGFLSKQQLRPYTQSCFENLNLIQLCLYMSFISQTLLTSICYKQNLFNDALQKKKILPLSPLTSADIAVPGVGLADRVLFSGDLGPVSQDPGDGDFFLSYLKSLVPIIPCSSSFTGSRFRQSDCLDVVGARMEIQLMNAQYS